MTSSQTPKLLTVAQAAEALNVSTKTVYRAIAAGELPVSRLGRAIRIALSDLEAYVNRRRFGGLA
jgi:excisionase family DNA binding protein